MPSDVQFKRAAEEKREDATFGVLCILQKGICTEFLNVPHPTLFCFLEEELFFKEKRIVNKQVWRGKFPENTL